MPSGNPIGKNRKRHLALPGIVVREMDSEIMLSTHLAVHHELHREGCRFTRLECHRTDDGGGGSTPLLNFNIRDLGELEGLVADVLELK